MKFLVTGGQGMLGKDIARALSFVPQAIYYAPGKAELDVRDAAAMQAAVSHAEGGWVVHCAARVDVEGCAREPDAARETIVTGTQHAIDLAKAAGARLFYPQSFLTYDGRTNPIDDDEEQRPLSFYGELKLEAQQLVEEQMGDQALVVRMAGFFGGEEADKNFVGRIIPVMRAAMERGQTQFEVGDRVWQPTWTRDLGDNSVELMRANCSGRYQMACHGEASFAQIAQEIVIALGWQNALEIVSVDASKVSANELGRRPDRAVLACRRLREEGLDLQRDWRATLHSYLRHPFFDQYRI